MASGILQVDIVSAETEIFSGEAKMVVATAAYGEVGILPGHAQLLTFLKPGYVRLIMEEDKEEVIYVSGGILEIQPHQVTVLADAAISAEYLDREAIMKVKKAAQENLSKSKQRSAQDLMMLTQAMAQIQAIDLLSRKSRRS